MNVDPKYLRTLSQEPRFWHGEAAAKSLDVVKYALAVAAVEREECAKLCEISKSQILLLAGEMTAKELRTVTAVFKGRAAAMRQRGMGTRIATGIAESTK